MMISPGLYIESVKNLTYEELIKERQNLLDEIIEMEQMGLYHLPEVRYQMFLLYLSELCRYMEDKYNGEIVHGDELWGEEEQEVLINSKN